MRRAKQVNAPEVKNTDSIVSRLEENFVHWKQWVGGAILGIVALAPVASRAGTHTCDEAVGHVHVGLTCAVDGSGVVVPVSGGSYGFKCFPYCRFPGVWGGYSDVQGGATLDVTGGHLGASYYCISTDTSI